MIGTTQIPIESETIIPNFGLWYMSRDQKFKLNNMIMNVSSASSIQLKLNKLEKTDIKEDIFQAFLWVLTSHLILNFDWILVLQNDMLEITMKFLRLLCLIVTFNYSEKS